MKIAMTALAVVLAAQAAPAFAQRGERGHDRDRQEFRAERQAERQRERSDNNDAPRAREAPRPAEAPRAAEPPRAREPRADRPDSGDGNGRRFGGGDGGRRERPNVPGDSVGRPGPWIANRGQPRGERRRDNPLVAVTPPANGGADRVVGDRRNDTRNRDWARDGRPAEGDRNWADGRYERRGGDGDRRRGDRDRYDGRRDGRGDGDRWDGRRDGRGDGDRRWDGRGDRRWAGHENHPRWERGRYPSVYHSHYRYRHSWRRPPGFYIRIWNFGDFLPRSWYGPEWYILDPWAYDLPLPPPGYEWVRVGTDAVLIEEWSGRVVQVVRDLFW